MLKKIFVNIMIIVAIFSLSVYATEVSESVIPTDTTQSESNESTSNDNKDEDKSNINTNTSENNTNTNTGTSTSDKTSSNKNTTTNKGQSTPKKDTTTITPEKSKNADLKELKIDQKGMSPEFEKEVTEYYLTIDLKVEQIKVTATPADEKAKVTVTGNKKLKEGKNTITITVKAEDGTSKTYYIYVTKVNDNDIDKTIAELKSLQITNYDLYPRFKSNIYNYNLNIGEDIQELGIIAEAENENAKIEIEGNSNLKDGGNIIKINVTAEDGETTRTYKINTYISSEKVEIKQESKTPAIILLIITGSVIVILGTFLTWKRIH